MKLYARIFLIVSVLLISAGLSADSGPVSQQSEEYENFSKLRQKAVDMSDSEICREAKGYTFDGGDYLGTSDDQEARNNCYFFYADRRMDIDICEKISAQGLPKSRRHGAEEMRDSCIYQVQNGLKIFLKEHCDRLLHKDGWYGEQCAKQIVIRTQDDRICDEYFVRYSGNWHGCRSGLKP